MGEVGFSGCQYGHGANVNKYVNTAFSIMCGIVTVGWSMYALGYFFGYSTGDVSDEVLNRVCNLADVMNENRILPWYPGLCRQPLLLSA